MTKQNPPIILANAHDARALAALIARRLEGLGYTVDQRSVPAALANDLGGDQRMLLIWSRGAAASAEFASKRHAGKFSVVRLASSPSPAKLRGVSVRLPRGGDAQGWRRLAEGSAQAGARPQSARAAPPVRGRGTSVLGGLGAALLLAAVAAVATYVARPDLLAQLTP